MDKLLDSESFSEDWEVTLLGEDSEGLEKAAAAQEVIDFSKKISKQPDKFYLHINAMGAGEYYGSNRNGDYFPEDNLIQWHKTFETSPAHVFRHHVNKDPAKAIGKVIYSYYNPRMHRVELIAEVDRSLGAPELAAIEDGNFPVTSMACHTPYDVCSVCNNKAHSRAEYCSHLSTQLNKVLPDGRKVMAINAGPLKFFDISIVIRPADITSAVLTKVANQIEDVVGSAEAAEMEGVSYGIDKKASILKEAIDKAADLIKMTDGDAVDASDNLNDILSQVGDPDSDILEVLKQFPLQDIITSFAYLGINPSLRFLIKILAGKYVGQEEEQISSLAMSALNVYGKDAIPLDAHGLIPDVSNPKPNEMFVKVLAKYMEGSSYQREYVEKRASTGHANWQVGRTPVANSKYFDRSRTLFNPGSIGDAGSLLKLVGGAIVAKIMINTLAGSFTKSASEVKSSNTVEKSAGLTTKLMELSLRKELENI